MNKTATAASLVLAAACLCGCNNTAKTHEEECKVVKADAATIKSMGIVNTKCPIMAEDALDPAVTVNYNGKKVAFCCAGCINKWNAMTDAQKAEKLAKAM
jgi:hypothetical protein